MLTNEKLALLRAQMKAASVNAYLVTTADPHQSEYISERYRHRVWISGFTGSAGTALITEKEALLWADGRYFIQAQKEIDGSEFKLMKMDTPGFPSLQEWLRKNLGKGDCLGMNGEFLSQDLFEELDHQLSPKGVALKANLSLIEAIWNDRPAASKDPIFFHELRFSGKSSAEKLAEIRHEMKQDDCEATVMAGLDDIAWLFNYRGNDVPNNPVALAFGLITATQAELFIDPDKCPVSVADVLKQNGVTLRPYEEIAAALANLKVTSIALNKKRLNHRLYNALPEDILVYNRVDYAHMIKASLNSTELACQKESYLRDSAVLTGFIHWIKERVKHESIDEYEAAEFLQGLRQKQLNYLDDSFTAISAYGPNAAMMHYRAFKENAAKLKAEGLYLIDSGAQYLDGTTDITRTIVLGELTAEEIRDYTLTLKSHINLARAIFLYGTTGHYLDALARQPLWKAHMDYKCGTGHAVGYVLGVHEGPQRFAKVPNAVALREGMVITNEPGVYKEGKHGIRLESDYVVVKDALVDRDQYLRFECLSFVPFEREALDPELLDAEEQKWVNDYHQEVYDRIAPRLDESLRPWLAERCKAL